MTGNWMGFETKREREKGKKPFEMKHLIFEGTMS